MLYNARWVEDYFDQYADKEWDRLALSPAREIQYLVHRDVLLHHIPAGASVLEIGAGPGRFTSDLVRHGCSVTVTDISSVQIELNRRKAQELEFDHGVREWIQLDMCSMPCISDESFDAVVAYGGPFSYVLDRRDDALRECLRVLQRGGVVLASVMSLWGTIHQYLDGVVGFSREENRTIIQSGDLTSANAKFAAHECHMFRSKELRDFFESHGLMVIDMASANALTPVHGEVLAAIRAEEDKWAQVVEMELQACRECLDSGTHIIIAGRKP